MLMTTTPASSPVHKYTHTHTPCCVPQAALNQLPLAEVTEVVRVQYAVVEKELMAVARGIVSSHPALSKFNDPVTLQLLVYVILGLPALLLAVLAVSLLGRGRASGSAGSSAAAGSRGKKGAAAPAKRSTVSKTARGSSAAAPAATPVRTTRGRAVRDGGDILFTP